MPNKWGDLKNGQVGGELSYLFDSGQGAVFFSCFYYMKNSKQSKQTFKKKHKWACPSIRHLKVVVLFVHLEKAKC